jgi:hypothetical protein
MSKLRRMWDWLLPGLICLSQMGAIAYYDAGAEDEQRYEPKRAEPHAPVSITFRPSPVIPLPGQ